MQHARCAGYAVRRALLIAFVIVRRLLASSLRRLAAVLALIVATNVACGDRQVQNGPPLSAGVTPTAATTRHAGERIAFDDGVALTVDRAEPEVANQAAWSAPGMRYVAVLVRIENAAASPITIAINQFNVVDDRGIAHTISAASMRSDRLAAPTNLAAGASVAGSLLFELPIPTISFVVGFRNVAVALATPAAARISGKLSYPSDFMPPLAIYAFSPDGVPARPLFGTRTTGGTTSYVLDGLAPGSYVIVAYTTSTGPNYGAAGYTRAVTCGLRPNCTDHRLIVLNLRAGEAMNGVDPTDYQPPSAFPPRPPM